MNPTIRIRMVAIAALAALAPNARALAQEPAHREEIPRLAGEAELRHNRQFLVSAESLASRLAGRDPATVVIHVGRSDSAYRAGHIPGARFLPLAAVAATVGGVPNEFPALDQLRRSFEQLGVGDGSRVVLVGDDAGLMAARAWVALDLLGAADHAALLDGGLAAWRALGIPLDTAAPAAPAPGRLTAGPRDVVVAAEWVRAHLGDSTVQLVDARPRAQYLGEEPPCPAMHPDCPQIAAERRGHIPGAASLYWMDALTAQGALRPMPELHHVLWRGAGANRPAVRTIVTYCRTGMQASHAYFVARYLGYPDVRLYDGSFIEWSGLPAAAHPVERGGQ